MNSLQDGKKESFLADQAELMVLAICLALGLVLGTVFTDRSVVSAASTVPLSTYNCLGTYGNSHCYRMAEWSAGGTYPAINGAVTQISLVTLRCPTGPCIYHRVSNVSDFIDDEMWVNDNVHHPSTCPLTCWVEAGYEGQASSSTGTQENFFWGDVRPGDSHINYHFISNLQTSDYGGTVLITIQHTSTNRFEIDVMAPTQGYAYYSTNNGMTADDIQIGQELQGTTGASSGVAHFTDNSWIGLNDAANLQTSDAPVSSYAPGSTNPVSGNWSTHPSSSNPGGNFYTSCGC